MTLRHQIWVLISKRFRPKRMHYFVETMAITPSTHVLDVGGTPFNWTLIPGLPTPTLCNLRPSNNTYPSVAADATRLPFKDNSWDVVFCNSVIEHVGTWENQIRMAHEIERVGKAFFVQTPAYGFPIEPHYLAPFIHWLPKTLRPYIGLFTPMRSKSLADSRRLAGSLRLLKKRELAALFPNSHIRVERFLGLPKSYLIYLASPITSRDPYPGGRDTSDELLGQRLQNLPSK